MTFLARRDFSTLQDRMNRIFREAFSPEGSDEALTTSNFAPPVEPTTRAGSIPRNTSGARLFRPPTRSS